MINCIKIDGVALDKNIIDLLNKALNEFRKNSKEVNKIEQKINER